MPFPDLCRQSNGRLNTVSVSGRTTRLSDLLQCMQVSYDPFFNDAQRGQCGDNGNVAFRALPMQFRMCHDYRPCMQLHAYETQTRCKMRRTYSREAICPGHRSAQQLALGALRVCDFMTLEGSYGFRAWAPRLQAYAHMHTDPHTCGYRWRTRAS